MIMFKLITVFSDVAANIIMMLANIQPNVIFSRINYK